MVTNTTDEALIAAAEMWREGEKQKHTAYDSFLAGAEWARKQDVLNIEAFKSETLDMLVNQLKDERARSAHFAQALQAVAINSCCNSCREAGLVARQALNTEHEKGR